MWPDFMKKATLAKRMDLAPGAIDQLVKRGVLPEPHAVGEARLWYWPDVLARIIGCKASEGQHNELADPYDTGVRRLAEASETSTPRQPGH